MKKSTKIVPIDLIAQSNKRSKSPSPTKSKNNSALREHSHQFSFSDQRSPFLSNSPQKQQKSPISKNLFGKSPKSPPRVYKNSNSPSKNKVVGKSNKSIQSPRLYKKTITEDQLFKKDMKNLKNTFFSSVRNNKQQTIRTLKEIGKYAVHRKSRQKQTNFNQNQSKKRVRDIPVQFYGFDPQDQRQYNPYLPIRPSKQEFSSLKQKQYQRWSKSAKEVSVQVDKIDQGTYFNFQDEFRQQLQRNQLQYIQMNIDNPNIKYSPVKPHHQYDKNYDENVYFPEIESINEVEIDGICEIFEMCQKYNEGDRLILKEFHQLLQQFQRLYFIKIIQQSEAEGVNKQKISIAEQNYYDLLKRFQQNFKIMFYRREACDIYDCLYYLKQCSRLDKVCSLFHGIKKILNI